MSERSVDLQPIFLEDHSLKQQQQIARRVLELIRDDFQRLGLDSAEASSIANPEDEASVEEQIEKMVTADKRNAIYGGVYTDFTDRELHGIVKVGPWTKYDAKPFGVSEVVRAQMGAWLPNPSARPQGLHVFSVEPNLVAPALASIFVDTRFLPMDASLRAAIHERDHELSDAFSDLGAPEDGPTATLKLGSHAAQYVLRRIPPVSKEEIRH